MVLSDIRPGDAVLVTATDEFFAFVDGWRGRVSGFNSGLVMVVCRHEGIDKTFFVPPDQLRLTVGA